jgi:hypothetical protein
MPTVLIVLAWNCSRNENKKVLMKIIDVPLVINDRFRLMEHRMSEEETKRFATTELNVIMMTRELKGST